MGGRIRSCPATSSMSIRHPITKILAAGEPPLPTELAPLARERFDGLSAVTISHPRFLEFTAPGVSKGRAIRWLARRLQDPARGGARHRRPVERHRDARRGRPRGGDADRADRGPGRRPLHRAAPARGGCGADDRGAGPGAARRGVGCRRPAGRGGNGDAGPRGPPVRSRSRSRSRSRHERAHRPRRCGGPRRGDRRPAAAAASSPCRPTRSTASRSRSTPPGGIERLFQVKRRPPDRGIMLLLDAAAQAPSIGVMGPAATALADACWPGGLTVVVPQRPDVAAAGGADRRDSDDRAARPGSCRAPGARGGRRAAADDLGQRLRPARGPRRRGDPRPARGRRRPHPRWRPGTRRPALDRRRLHRRAAGDPAGRRRAS